MGIYGFVITKDITPVLSDGFDHTRMGFGDGICFVPLLKGSDKRTPHDTDGEHSDSGDGIEGKGSPFRVLFGYDTQHGGPEEGFTDPINGGGDEDHGQSRGAGQEEKPHGCEGGGGHQKSQGSEFTNNGSDIEAKDHHDSRGIDQYQDGRRSDFQHGSLHQTGYPPIGAQLGDGQGYHDENEDDHDGTAQRAAIGEINHGGSDGQNPHQGVAPSKYLPQLGGYQPGRDQGANGAEFRQHFLVGGSRGDPFVNRVVGVNQHDEKDDGRNDDQGDEDQPLFLTGFPQSGGQEPADHKAARPTGVQNIEPLGFLLVEHGGDDRVDVGFHRSISKTENDGPDVEVVVSGRVVRSAMRQERENPV